MGEEGVSGGGGISTGCHADARGCDDVRRAEEGRCGGCYLSVLVTDAKRERRSSWRVLVAGGVWSVFVGEQSRGLLLTAPCGAENVRCSCSVFFSGFSFSGFFFSLWHCGIMSHVYGHILLRVLLVPPSPLHDFMST